MCVQFYHSNDFCYKMLLLMRTQFSEWKTMASQWGEPFDKIIETSGKRRCGPWSTIQRRWRGKQRRRRRMCKTEQNTLYSSCTIAYFLNCYHLSVDSVLDKISHRPNTGSIIGGPYVEPLCWVCMKICNWTGIGWILRSFVRPPCSIFPGRSVQQLLPDLGL